MEQFLPLLILLVAISLAKHILVKDHQSGKAFIVDTGKKQTGLHTGPEPGGDYSDAAETKTVEMTEKDVQENQEKHGLGCPKTLMCERRGPLCMIITPYNKNYLIHTGHEYESGRLKCICGIKKGKNMCGIHITNLQEKDFGNWRCGNPSKSLKTLIISRPKKETQCSGKTLNDTISGWSAWASWQSCSQTCGPAAQTRLRSCNETSTATKGRFCPGDKYQHRDCNNHPCPDAENLTLDDAQTKSLTDAKSETMVDTKSDILADDENNAELNSPRMIGSNSKTLADNENNNLSEADHRSKNKTLANIKEEIETDENVDTNKLKDTENGTIAKMVDVKAKEKPELTDSG